MTDAEYATLSDRSEGNKAEWRAVRDRLVGDVKALGTREWAHRAQAFIDEWAARDEQRRRANSPWVLLGPYGPMRHKDTGLSYQKHMAYGMT
jgi:hypothetical protein